jgi:Cys-tRNA(Pro)/Cys-tRNA(Cys) deacylase
MVALMIDDIEPASAAVAELRAASVPHRVAPLGRVSSVEEAAAAAGVPVDGFAKTLVVRVGEGSYVLVCVPGDARLDYPSLREFLGVRRLTMPDAEEAQAATGYARGTITPWGAGGWPVVVDQSLAARDEVAIGSGVRGWVVHLSGLDLVSSTGGLVAAVAECPRP